VGRLLRPARPQPQRVAALAELAALAARTAAAGQEVDRDHPVADSDRLTGIVSRDSVAQSHDPADELMAEHRVTQRRALVVVDVHIGAAHVGASDLEHQGARARRGDLELHQLDGLGADQGGDLTSHGPLLRKRGTKRALDDSP
jgi:hypothetical protein